MKRVLFFGIYDLGYARTRILTEGFTALGYEVVHCRVDPRVERGVRKYRLLLQQGRALRHEPFDQIFVLFPGQTVVWLARLLFGNRIIFDAFVSLYDSNAFDRKKYGSHSPRAWRDWLLDRFSCALARKVLVDTTEHKRYFVEQLGVRADKLLVVPVGASNEWFRAGNEERRDEGLRNVVFYGSFIPLHGADVIIHAAALVADLPIRFELIGSGQEYEHVREHALSLNLAKVVFKPRVSLEELIARVREADTCLGIFGATPKASRVIPNKVYECAALGKSVITADTPAMRETFADQENVFLVKPTPQALAEALRVLAANPALRTKLGAGAHARMAAYTPKRIVGEFLECLAQSYA